VEACGTYDCYIKTIDLTKNGSAIPIVDELAKILYTFGARASVRQGSSKHARVHFVAAGGSHKRLTEVLAQFGRTPNPDFVLAIEFERQNVAAPRDASAGFTPVALANRLGVRLGLPPHSSA
jgi:hypothetical protein